VIRFLEKFIIDFSFLIFMGLHEIYGHNEEQVFFDGRRFTAFFPKIHPTVDGLIYHVEDMNPNKGSFGAFSWNKTTMYLLPKRTTL
jgi:hypothetical protein